MLKKLNLLSFFYSAGMLLIIAGFFFPLGSFIGFKENLIDIVTNGRGDVRIGAAVSLAGAVAGAVISFIKPSFFNKLVCLILLSCGFIYIYANTGTIARKIGGFIAKHSELGIGSILIVAGILLSVAGLFSGKRK